MQPKAKEGNCHGKLANISFQESLKRYKNAFFDAYMSYGE